MTTGSQTTATPPAPSFGQIMIIALQAMAASLRGYTEFSTGNIPALITDSTNNFNLIVTEISSLFGTAHATVAAQNITQVASVLGAVAPTLVTGKVTPDKIATAAEVATIGIAEEMQAAQK